MDKLIKSVFRITKMDCPSEEQLIRMKLGDNKNIQSLSFDIPRRILEVFHTGTVEPITEALETLKLDSTLQQSDYTDEAVPTLDSGNKRILIWVLLINLVLFVIEIITGFISHSMGLVADSLDMLADVLVYGLSLWVIGRTIAKKKHIATISGYFQMGLAIFGLIEVLRRFFGDTEVPTFHIMIIVSTLALIGNATSMYLLKKTKSTEAHMQASVIFTNNDVLANIGVIIAGVLVYLTSSKLPDLVVGTIVFFLVARGALKILQLAK